jgi:hypothetical protein
MAACHRVARGMRRQPDAEFLWLDLFRASDLLGVSSLAPFGLLSLQRAAGRAEMH